MAISCVYCGGSHDTAAEVRQCWSEHEGEPAAGTPRDGSGGPPPPASPPQSAAPAPPPRRRASPPSSRPAPLSTPAPIDRAMAAAGPGPDALGRNTVVAPGQDPPSAWTGAPRVVIDEETLADPTRAITTLRQATHDRRRVVIELEVAAPNRLADPEHTVTEATTIEPHELGPRFSFELDELHCLVWSNSVDHRASGAGSWFLLDQALHHGATEAADGAGDVVLPSGEVAWLDGGPLRFNEPIDGAPVLHGVNVEHQRWLPPASNQSTAELAPDQLAAVTHEGGPARIIAPAGSGKTRVLTERARHLLTQWNLPAGAVTLVAFNKRAQEEMQERTADLPDLQVRTLNSIALAIVNGTPPFAPQPRRWQTIDEPDVRRIIGNLVKFPRRRNSDPVAPWIEALSLIRLGMVAPDEAEKRYDGDVDGLASTWPQFRATLQQQGVVDFDDQIHRSLLVLLNQPEARAAAQRACRMLLVDEFQDLTPAHLLLIRLLAAPGGAVFGVGDDDQTIYGYNGADPGWLIDFDQTFPGAGSHPLEVNYRCPAGIVDAVDRLLRHNRRRVTKTIRAASSDPQGWTVETGPDPVSRSSDAVAGFLAQGAAPQEIAVLTRVNALLAPVQVALTGTGVPISGGVGLEFTNRTAVRAALAWIRLATSGRGGPRRFNTEDVREALLRPSRSFHPRINDWISEQGSIGDLERLADRLNNEKDAARLLEFSNDIQSLQAVVEAEGTTSDIMDALIDAVGLAGAITTLDTHRRGMNRAAQGDDLTALRHLAALHDDPRTFGRWLNDQLAVKRSIDGVVLATVHRVKGQEWPHVVVHLADADQYPHRLAEDVEEERRLFHVAVTRASRHATVVAGPSPSPFIEELTNEPSPDTEVRAHQPQLVHSRSKPKAKSAPADDLSADEQARYDALATLRHELRDGKPAYVVFDNKTAAALARANPSSTTELLRVPGIGPAKVDKYGDAILGLLTGL